MTAVNALYGGDYASVEKVCSVFSRSDCLCCVSFGFM